MTDGRDLALPAGYTDLLGELKNRVRAARATILRTINTQLIELYWSIGQEVSAQQESQGWGSGVINRLAVDLRAEFPEMKGFSARNVQYMTTFARAWKGGSNCATACCAIAMGAHHRAARQTFRPRNARLVRFSSRGIRLVPERPDEHDHE